MDRDGPKTTQKLNYENIFHPEAIKDNCFAILLLTRLMTETFTKSNKKVLSKFNKDYICLVLKVGRLLKLT